MFDKKDSRNWQTARPFRLLTMFCLAFVCLTVGFGLVGCKKADESQEQTGSDKQANVTAGASNGASGWKLEKVTDIEYEETLDLPGATVRGYETVQLLAKVGGYVTRLGTVDGETVDIGTPVAAKIALAVLDVPELENELTQKMALVTQAKSEVAQAKAAVVQAKAELTRREKEREQAGFVQEEKQALVELRDKAFERIKTLKGLVNQKSRDEAKFALAAATAAEKSAASAILTAKASVDAAGADIEKANADKARADAQVEVAKAAVAQAQTMIDYATIKSPFAGVITERLVDHGSFVRPATSNSGATPLFVVTRTDMVRVVVAVPNTRAVHVRRGQAVWFHSVGGLQAATIPGRVSRVATNLDRESRMLRIEADFKNPVTDPKTGKKHTLVPGMFGSVRITLQSWGGKNGRLPVVPASALVRGQEGGPRYVVVVGSDGAAQHRAVDIVFEDGSRAGVREGVKVDETIVLQGGTGIAEGAMISAEMSK